jgi:hypothetical protein
VTDELGNEFLRGDAPEAHRPGRAPGGDERSVGAERDPAIAPPGSGRAGQVCSCLPEAKFQSVTPTSRAAVASSAPSGLYATDEMIAESLPNITVCWPVFRPQSRTVPSQAAEATCAPSGRNATSYTKLLCPHRPNLRTAPSRGSPLPLPVRPRCPDGGMRRPPGAQTETPFWQERRTCEQSPDRWPSGGRFL